MTWWQWLLVIAGGVILALLILVGIAVTYVKAKWKGFTQGLADAFKGLGGMAIPQTLKLQPIDVDLDAAHPGLAAGKVEAERCRLQVGGPFNTGSEATGGPIVALTLADPNRSLMGLLIQSPDGSIVKDVMTWYEDEHTLTHSTMVPKLHSPPQRAKVGVEDTDLPRLIDQHLRERPDKPMKSFTLDEVPATVKQYAEDTWFWQATRGGLSDAEIEQQVRDANAANPDADADDPLAGAEMLKVMIRSQAVSFLEDRLEKQLREETTMSVAEWEEIEHRLQWVHDLKEPDTLAWSVMPDAERNADDEDDDDDELQGPTQTALGSGPIRETFARLNDQLPPERKLRFLQTVKITDTLASYEGDVYVEPEEEDDDDEFDDD
ncbi:MAG: hypothetical protein AAGD32_13540 [Planctomycetota bacterium]